MNCSAPLPGSPRWPGDDEVDEDERGPGWIVIAWFLGFLLVLGVPTVLLAWGWL